ncbi:hypothetical protein VTN77DRAFT_9772 [Rasamsonia byssochlamydoides]|uniref:uncharacterized protein n=1 Tax=Rasamsonia byssochlamydoides TaxID=89139 RepID=UPI003744090F
MRRTKLPVRISTESSLAYSRIPAARVFSIGGRASHRALQPQRQQHLRYLAINPPSLGRDGFSAISTADTHAQLEKVLTPSLLQGVRDFWFQHVPDEEHLIIPGESELQRWFFKDAEFDRGCVAQFHHVLETIRHSNASVRGILAAAKPASPLDWLSIILLLDQITRNCYRGDESAVVFRFFDPLAEEITLRAIEAGIPTQSSPVRYRLSYRFWFLLPLMHSENIEIHNLAIRQHEQVAADVDELIREDRDLQALNDDELMCRTVLLQQRGAAKKFLASILDYEKRHQVVIARFGRYPHRNKALGRAPTEEETEYLENGGEVFG